MGYHPDVDAATEAAIAALKSAGAEVIDVEIGTYDKWNDAEFEVLLYEFKDGLNAYLKRQRRTAGLAGGADRLEQGQRGEAMPIFGQEIFEKAQAKGPLTDAAYLKARDDARRLAGKDGLLAALDKHKLDAVIAPSMSPAWLTDHVLGDHFVGAGYGIAAVAGTPSITVPVGDIAWPAARADLHGPRLQRSGTARLGLRLRAGDQGAQAAAIPADAGRQDAGHERQIGQSTDSVLISMRAMRPASPLTQPTLPVRSMAS